MPRRLQNFDRDVCFINASTFNWSTILFRQFSTCNDNNNINNSNSNDSNNDNDDDDNVPFIIFMLLLRYY